MTPDKESLITQLPLNNVFKTLLMVKPLLPKELKTLLDIDRTLPMNLQDGKKSWQCSINCSKNSRMNKRQSAKSSISVYPSMFLMRPCPDWTNDLFDDVLNFNK